MAKLNFRPGEVYNASIIYNELFSRLIERNWEKRSEHPVLRKYIKSSNDLRQVLHELALAMFKHQKDCLSAEFIPAIIQEKWNLNNQTDFRDLLLAFYFKELRQSEFAVEFLHKTFGEYLAAEAIWHRMKTIFNDTKKSVDDILKSMTYLFNGEGFLTKSIINYLHDLIFNEKGAKLLNTPELKLLASRMEDKLPDLIRSGFYYPDINHNVVSQAIRVFYGFISVYLRINLNENKYSQMLIGDFCMMMIMLASKNKGFLNLKGVNLSMFNLIGADLSGADLSEADLSGANLSGVNLNKADLTKAKLHRAQLVGANLSGADLTGADLTKAILKRADLTTSKLSKADLSEADLSGSYLNMAYLVETILFKANLSRADLSGADLSGANLSKANLFKANLFKANLAGADLFKAKLMEADLKEADLTRADLKEADLSEADLSKSDLSRVNLKGAYLIESYLLGTILIKAKLEGANLAGADLEGADLLGADLTGADLTGAHLIGTNLTGAILTGAILKKATLTGTIEVKSKV